MRSFAYVVLGLFSIYSIQTPRVQAAPGELTPEKVQAFGVDVYADLEKEGYEFFDKQGVQVHAKDFYANPLRDLTVVSPSSDEARLKIRVVNHGDIQKSLKLTLVASEVETGKVLSRRSFEIDATSANVATAKLRILQTMKSMDGDITAKLGVKNASVLNRAKTILAGLFGIPSAHAGFQGNERKVFGALFVMIIGLYVLFSFPPKTVAGRRVWFVTALIWTLVSGGYSLYYASTDAGFLPKQ